MKRFFAIVLVGVLVALGVWSAGLGERSGGLRSGWGVDACLTCHVPLERVPEFLGVVGEADVKYLRERGVGDVADPANWTAGRMATHRLLQDAGYETVGFTSFPIPKDAREHEWNQLPEDLLTVYAAAADLTRRTGGVIRIWEMVGEPDTFYCRDLPERVVAYQKAVYLGLRDGARRWGPGRQPVVLMGALGLSPGPWLERAARNGLYDYTDGMNFHFYGHARDFRGAVQAHREVAERFLPDRKLPVWVTECGISAVPDNDFEEARGREIQRAFTELTTNVAREEGLAVFMPFILVHERDPFALVRRSGEPYPAWTTYADLTRTTNLPDQPVANRPPDPNRLVVQWLPDNTTCFPHKTGGAYWFRGSAVEPKPIRGRWVVYNFSPQPVTGTLRWRTDGGLVWSADGAKADGGVDVHVPAMGAADVVGSVSTDGTRYVRGMVAAEFVPQAAAPGIQASRAEAGFATKPRSGLLPQVQSVVATRPESFEWLWAPEPYNDQVVGGPWIGINGVRLTGAAGASPTDLSAPTCFEVSAAHGDPRVIPMAVTRVNGLPTGVNAFLRLRYSDDSRPGQIRVDLVDDQGQRFAIGENLGLNPHRPDPDETLLSYDDFHPFAFARLTAHPIFQPEKIREIQLRFYPARPGARICVGIDVVSVR